MHDTPKIIAGVLIFLSLATFPFWYGKGKTASPPLLPIDTPEIQQLTVKKCIEPASYMAVSHMELLNSWRDAVVRDGHHLYVNREGKKFSISLSQTCLSCHSNKDKFCDACHNYSGVKPNCWSCHVVPKEAQR
ncbi:MAG: sulfate reduction electron transfer complex DsrMKJOP subunit DsrJ [Thermodesulfobacteriota bacterium]|nr:sulfate reduction electron transfer complex DsrMKJOP subunit DsrJ [Thermodesulfobacteriota bacterium]